MSRRVTLEFSDDAADRLDAIKKLTEADNDAETIRNALRVYEWHTKQAAAGYEIGLVKDGMVEKIVKVII